MVVVAASSGVANALKLLSVSIVNVFIYVPLSTRLTVTITFITLVADTSKAILLVIGKAIKKRCDWALSGM